MKSIAELFAKTYTLSRYVNPEYIYNYTKEAITPLWNKKMELTPDQLNHILQTISSMDYIRATYKAYWVDSDHNKYDVDLAKLFLKVDSWEYSKWKFPFRYVGGNIYGHTATHEKIKVFSDDCLEIYERFKPSVELESALESLMNYYDDGNWYFEWCIDLIQLYTEKDISELNRELINEGNRREEAFR